MRQSEMFYGNFTSIVRKLTKIMLLKLSSKIWFLLKRVKCAHQLVCMHEHTPTHIHSNFSVLERCQTEHLY